MKTMTIEMNPNRELTQEEIQMLAQARSMPIIYDDDSPELTDEQLAGFKRIAQKNRTERNKETISIRLTPKAIRKAKSLGKGYTSVLSRILEDVLSDNDSLSQYL